MTNADRMDAMSIKEKAKFLTTVVADGCPPAHDWDCMKDEYGMKCTECDEYESCRLKNDLRRKRGHCPKAKLEKGEFYRVLKTGDPCPSCGQPIKWKNERILQLLTYAANGELTSKGLGEMLVLMEEEGGAG